VADFAVEAFGWLSIGACGWWMDDGGVTDVLAEVTDGVGNMVMTPTTATATRQGRRWCLWHH